MRTVIKACILFICSAILFCSCTHNKIEVQSDKPTVAVSIVPQVTFVKAIAGNLVNVVTMIPVGKSPANYAPNPIEIESFSQALVYFAIGVPTEQQNILPRTKDLNPNMKIINLAEQVKKIYPEREFSLGNRDPHIWLSPKRAKVMIEIITKELCSIDPKNKDIYQKNSIEYIQKLDKLDKDIETSITSLKNKTFIVYHPSFGYFADDYGLTMLSLENEGKQATARDLQNMIDKAKKENIKVIFYQAEIDSKQSQVFAEEIGGKTEKLEPLAENYLENLQNTVKIFRSVLE